MATHERKQRISWFPTGSHKNKVRGHGHFQPSRHCDFGDRTLIKFVEKARQWCKTIIEGDKQTQVWSSNKPGK